jgi:hypothetical protein
MMLEAMTALLSFGFRVSGLGSITGVGFRVKMIRAAGLSSDIVIRART